MLSTDYNFIYIHIPKTAGTSITAVLKSLPERRFSRLRELIRPRSVRGWRYRKHDTALHIKSEIGERQWRKFFSFTFVRNPWDLMVSCYSWWLQDAYKWDNLSDHAQSVAAMNGFNEFIFSKYGQEMITDIKGEIFDWISDENGRILVDFVGKAEKIKVDWRYVCRQIGIPCQALPWHNKTDHRHYSQYYTDKSRELVGQRFHRTIGAFNYEFIHKDSG